MCVCYCVWECVLLFACSLKSWVCRHLHASWQLPASVLPLAYVPRGRAQLLSIISEQGGAGGEGRVVGVPMPGTKR